MLGLLQKKMQCIRFPFPVRGYFITINFPGSTLTPTLSRDIRGDSGKNSTAVHRRAGILFCNSPYGEGMGKPDRCLHSRWAVNRASHWRSIGIFSCKVTTVCHFDSARYEWWQWRCWGRTVAEWLAVIYLWHFTIIIIIIYWQNTALQQCRICRHNHLKHYVLNDRKAKWISTYNCPLKIQ